LRQNLSLCRHTFPQIHSGSKNTGSKEKGRNSNYKENKSDKFNSLLPLWISIRLAEGLALGTFQPTAVRTQDFGHLAASAEPARRRSAAKARISLSEMNSGVALSASFRFAVASAARSFLSCGRFLLPASTQFCPCRSMPRAGAIDTILSQSKSRFDQSSSSRE